MFKSFFHVLISLVFFYPFKTVNSQHFQHFDEKHGKSFVTNKMIDNVIDNIGPDVAETMIKFGVDKGLR